MQARQDDHARQHRRRVTLQVMDEADAAARAVLERTRRNGDIDDECSEIPPAKHAKRRMAITHECRGITVAAKNRPEEALKRRICLQDEDRQVAWHPEDMT